MHSQEDDERLALELIRSAAALQQAIHNGVEAGLKVTVKIQTMHQVANHYPEPLVEVDVERVIRLT